MGRLINDTADCHFGSSGHNRGIYFFAHSKYEGGRRYTVYGQIVGFGIQQ